MTWTVGDREKAIIQVDITKNANTCSRCKYLSMDKLACNWWCCDIELDNACYQYETKVELINFV